MLTRNYGVPAIFGEDLFDEWMGGALSSFADLNRQLYGKNTKSMMKTDVKEIDGGYQVAVEMPGFDKNEISVELDKGYLTITASKDMNQDEQDENGKYIRRERYSGTMQRSFYVGENVQQEDIKAKYENGVLKLEVPKEDTQKIQQSRYIAIEG
ncbi:MAG: Hsp20/alpha crystallin family protein [Butyrivibrio sp.]|nr:Hsp20/alpha crystallin family protein [Acetatifactor muris]MCM1558777.1 Hsp20/alpha crystallin family protein [Butyrivibrio sp.]